MVHDWVIKGLGTPSRVCATGHRVPVVGLLLYSFIREVIIIIGLNKLYDVSFLQNAVDAANMEGHPDGSRSEQRADLLAPDLTRDLVDGRHTGSSQNEAANGNVSQSDVSSVDFNQAPKDLPPPSYSSLFPDLV